MTLHVAIVSRWFFTQACICLAQLCIYALVFLNAASTSNAQLRTSVIDLAETVNRHGWVTFKNEERFQAATLFEEHGDKFGLGKSDEMRVFKKVRDTIGWTQHRYQQFHDGLRIEGAVFILHEFDNRVVKGNGKIVNDLHLASKPSITKQQALEIALSGYDLDQSYWEDTALESLIKQSKKDTSATYFPSPTLVITRSDDELPLSNSNLTLAYHINVMSKEAKGSHAVYVDAHNGKVFKRVLLWNGCDAGSTATTLYNGSQSIGTEEISGLGCRLHNTAQGGGILTQSQSPPSTSFDDVFHANSTWGATYNMFTQAHWSASVTYSYFISNHSRNSYDGVGGIMKQVVGRTIGPNWNGVGYFTYFPDPEYVEDDDGLWQVSLDIVGHEWTHGLTQIELMGLSDPLIPTGEFGALYESYGDIFGSMVECEGSPSNCDLVQGNVQGNRSLPTSRLRDMCSPRIYGDSSWDSAGNLGFHDRGRVLSYWFCLLVNGGTDTNTHPCRTAIYDVPDIGRQKAAAIAYRTLTTKTEELSDFYDARLGSIEAVEELVSATYNPLGFVSADIDAVKEAWNAAGVYEDHIAFRTKAKCGTYTGTEVIKAMDELYTCQSSPFTTVASGADIDFKSARRITMYAGFTAESGSSFRAYLDSCDAEFFEKIAGHRIKSNPSTDSVSYDRRLYDHCTVNAMPTVTTRPNPTRSTTEVTYVTSIDGYVDVSMVDSYGNVALKILSNQIQESGKYVITIDSSSLTPGVYFCMVKSNGLLASQKVLVL